jgi:hypothetical protein
MAMRQSSAAACRAVAKISWAFLRKGLTKFISAHEASFIGLICVQTSTPASEKRIEHGKAARMPETVFVIGTLPSELNWVRMLVALLRHPDPNVPELTRQALLYLSESADGRGEHSLDQAG